ncbi:site-2 protease family protein [Oscillatoria sp. FACHB-1407]|uniref:site-2 protease family protein n=1 Tax=Oscillatoria sp. FACHB-1407 TaxID=2692847 RepID=UPI001686DC61|nr:site-2 protease family protein [Oscillatoria sp. FACHB-1407]MBD2461116.1 site-2 protease family protein [Oscillatoria sp. FACHB-1407]
MITLLILVVALIILGWGFYRARPFGKLGILAWLQSVVLMAPWLLFFGLFTAGVYLNLVSIIFLIVLSAGLYIFLGNRLRAEGSNSALLSRLSVLPNSTDPTRSPEPSDSPTDPGITPETPKPVETALEADVLSIPADDLKLIQGIFGVDTFFATETIPYREGAIFKGNLRGEVDASYQRLANNLAARVGDRYRLFLVAGPDDRPTVIVLPRSNDPQPTTVLQGLLALVLFLTTIAASVASAGLMLGFDISQQPDRFREALPISIGILSILAAHELGHRLLARRHHVRLSPPFFIPTWEIASFGAITRFESLLPNRNVLFDVAFAGPAAGGVVSVVLLITGLLLSQSSSLFQVQSNVFQGSIFVGALARIILGDTLQQPLVGVHPLVLVGWLGLVLTAINLLPTGQLDGGRIVQAIYGRKVAGRTTIITLIVLGLAALVNVLALYWAIVILFLQRDLERPPLNELSEPDDARAALGLLALFLMAAILLPLAPNLAGRLGIGG